MPLLFELKISNYGDITAQPNQRNRAPTSEKNTFHSQRILSPGLTLRPGTEETCGNGS